MRTIEVLSSAANATNIALPWYERIDLFQVVAASAILIVAWFFVRTLRQIDLNQRILADSLNELSREFYRLQGEHQAIHLSLHCNDRGKE